jgi:hypothetical protein
MSKTKHAMMTRGLEPPPPPPDPPLGLTDRYLVHVDRLDAFLEHRGAGWRAVTIVVAVICAVVLLRAGLVAWWLR